MVTCDASGQILRCDHLSPNMCVLLLLIIIYLRVWGVFLLLFSLIWVLFYRLVFVEVVLMVVMVVMGMVAVVVVVVVRSLLRHWLSSYIPAPVSNIHWLLQLFRQTNDWIPRFLCCIFRCFLLFFSILVWWFDCCCVQLLWGLLPPPLLNIAGWFYRLVFVFALGFFPSAFCCSLFLVFLQNRIKIIFCKIMTSILQLFVQ